MAFCEVASKRPAALLLGTIGYRPLIFTSHVLCFLPIRNKTFSIYLLFNFYLENIPRAHFFSGPGNMLYSRRPKIKVKLHGLTFVVHVSPQIRSPRAF